MRSAAFREEGAGLIKAQLTVNGETHLGGVIVFLAVIFPPADRTELKGAGCIEGFISATRATIANFDCGTHMRIDGKKCEGDYGAVGPKLAGFPEETQI